MCQCCCAVITKVCPWLQVFACRRRTSTIECALQLGKLRQGRSGLRQSRSLVENPPPPFQSQSFYSSQLPQHDCSLPGHKEKRRSGFSASVSLSTSLWLPLKSWNERLHPPVFQSGAFTERVPLTSRKPLKIYSHPCGAPGELVLNTGVGLHH